LVLETRARQAQPPFKIKEPTNRNFLSIVGFKFVLNKCPKVDFYCNQANIPTLSLGTSVQPTYLRQIPQPGTELSYEDLSLSFIVDEECENYIQIYDWITSLGFPESFQQFQELKPTDRNDPSNEYSDGTLIILNSDYNPSLKIKFKDLFPVSLSGIPFNATETEQRYFTANVTFKYTIFDLIDVNGKKV
tara:strand:- start:926 stop:1495 length:570 start_codon:yes stop_codon:yes gene_type:complete